TLSSTEFQVIHNRQPVFVQLSDGSIQNRYTLKMLNKTNKTMEVQYGISGLEGATLHGIDHSVIIEPGKVIPLQALVRVPDGELNTELEHLTFIANASLVLFHELISDITKTQISSSNSDKGLSETHMENDSPNQFKPSNSRLSFCCCSISPSE
ncbi:hypothetical protein C9933_02310, partial [Methylophaga nitratireducenticrescens]